MKCLVSLTATVVCALRLWGGEPVRELRSVVYENFLYPGVVQERWEPLKSAWEVTDGTLRTDSSTPAITYLGDVLLIAEGEISATLRMDARRNPEGWAVAGVVLYSDAVNYWHLALVEGPDGAHYAELAEKLDGAWQAQRDGPTALEQTIREGDRAGWDYGKDYRLTLRLDDRGIHGEVIPAGADEPITRLGYAWSAPGAVSAGRPGLTAAAVSVACSTFEVRAPDGRAAVRGSVPEPGEYRVAVLGDLRQTPTGARATPLAAALVEQGLQATELQPATLASPEAFGVAKFDCVVFPDSPRFPAEATGNVLRFLRQGGDLVLLGGRPFTEPVWLRDRAWRTADEIAQRLAATPVEGMLFDFEHGLGTWRRGTDRPEAGTTVGLERGPTGGCMCLRIRDLQGWDTQAAELPQRIPPEHNLLCLRARGDAGTPQMLVELVEDDGSRWIATVEISPRWAPYALSPDRFVFWRDGGSTSRGEAGDQVRFSRTIRISFGLAASHLPRLRGDHTLWVDQVGTGHSAEAVAARPVLPQLNVFDDCAVYAFDDAVRVHAGEGQRLVHPGTVLAGEWEGTAAVGFAFPNESSYVSLLEAEDRFGRNRGAALGLLLNYAGAYRGSSWLFSGISSPAFYRDQAFMPMFGAVMRQLATQDLVRRARSEALLTGAAPLTLTTPAPHEGFLRLSDDRRHLVYPDGRRFFMIGCNYVGGFERCGGRQWRDEFYDPAAVEDDFRKARDAGLNIMRYWLQTSLDADIREGDLAKVEAIRECARRYGVHLLLDLPGTGYATVEQMLASHRAIASAFRDEPMVLGYDLRNEPYVTTIGGIIYPQDPPPVCRSEIRAHYADQLDMARIDSWIEERPWWLHLPGRITGDTARNLVASWFLWGEYRKAHDLRSSVLKGLGGTSLTVEPKWRPLVDAVNASLDQWLRVQVDAIREVDPNHLLTVGYNTALVCLPANKQLDFVSSHVYQRPFSLADVSLNVSALDRLAARWPDRPITFGEFGYSNGIPMDRHYLDPQTSAVGEMLHFLYAWAHDYDGCKKWMLVDWPLAVMRHYGDWDRGLSTRIYEARFGLYYDDGSLTGRPKPIVHALRFFRDYVDRAAPGGTLDIVPDESSIGAAYVYRDDNALFIGARECDVGILAFTASEPTNLMVSWADDSLRLMSTADATVTFQPDVFVKHMTPTRASVAGRHGGVTVLDGKLRLKVLAGEVIDVRAE